MCWFGLIAALTCLHVAAPAAMDQHQIELKQHYEHLAYIAEFPCHDPQPRVFSVNELFSECKTHGRAYFPDVTVLHHCGGSTGCCTSGNVCIPTQAQTLHLPFKVTYLEDMEHHKKGSWEIQYYSLENHTHCSCEDVSHKHHHDSTSGHEHNYDQNKDTSTEYGRRPEFQNQRPGQFAGPQGSQSSQRPDQFVGSQSSQRPGQFIGSQGSQSSERPDQFVGSQSSERPDQFGGSQSSQRPGQSIGSQGSQSSQSPDQFVGFQNSQSSPRPDQFSGSPQNSYEGNDLSSTEPPTTSTTSVEDLFSSLF